MYTKQPAFILGFHGCDLSVVENVITGKKELNPSKNSYDWLGHGAYFWENDPSRALKYAQMLKESPNRGKGKVESPAVLGAIIDLGNCLNLMEIETLQLVRLAYDTLTDSLLAHGDELPQNIPGYNGGNDLLLRHLDCAVIEILHKINDGREFDSIRGLFFEGEELYPNAGFKTKTHIQICVRNPNCIKGYFLPKIRNNKYPMP
jgi:hypothetical protein